MKLEVGFTSIVGHRIAQGPEWDILTRPPIQAAGYEYVFAGNGIFIRAEDSRMEAMVMHTPADVKGLAHLESIARLKVGLIPCAWLRSVVESMRRHLPNECIFQMLPNADRWRTIMPDQQGTPTSVWFDDNPLSVVDIHSHNTMHPFWSTTDDADEQGLRFYVVIGNLDLDVPTARARVGVYGHHVDIPLNRIFDDDGCEWPVRDLFGTTEDNDAELIG